MSFFIKSSYQKSATILVLSILSFGTIHCGGGGDSANTQQTCIDGVCLSENLSEAGNFSLNEVKYEGAKNLPQSRYSNDALTLSCSGDMTTTDDDDTILTGIYFTCDQDPELFDGTYQIQATCYHGNIVLTSLYYDENGNFSDGYASDSGCPEVEFFCDRYGFTENGCTDEDNP